MKHYALILLVIFTSIRLVFKIKDGYKSELQVRETLKPLLAQKN